MSTEQPSSRQSVPTSNDDPAALSGDVADTPRVEQPQSQPNPPRTRLSAAFSGFVVGAIVLILLLIFILENTRSVEINYLGASGHLALGIALLLAAVGGALVLGVLGTARITQVRRHAKRHSRARRR
jgi:uncharacterized integral membrane protein